MEFHGDKEHKIPVEVYGEIVKEMFIGVSETRQITISWWLIIVCVTF